MKNEKPVTLIQLCSEDVELLMEAKKDLKQLSLLFESAQDCLSPHIHLTIKETLSILSTIISDYPTLYPNTDYQKLLLLSSKTDYLSRLSSSIISKKQLPFYYYSVNLHRFIKSIADDYINPNKSGNPVNPVIRVTHFAIRH